MQLSVTLVGDEKGGVILPEIHWEHRDKALGSFLLDGLICVPHLFVVVFDGRRHIAGQGLRSVVKQAKQGGFFAVQLFAEAFAAYLGEGVRYHRHLKGMLRQILAVFVPHQRPAIDIFHP